MSNSKTSTSSAQTVGENSILDQMISESTVQTSAQAVILPLVENLPSGQYESEIVDVNVAIQNGVAVGIDCTNKLTDSKGKSLLVQFRYFAPADVNSLKQVLSSYGFAGRLGSALMGLKETVEIAPRPNSTRYMYIAQRVLSAAYESSSSHVTTSLSPSKKKGGLSARLSNRSNQPMQTSRRPLISVDEEDIDDEFDDFLDDSEY